MGCGLCTLKALAIRYYGSCLRKFASSTPQNGPTCENMHWRDIYPGADCENMRATKIILYPRMGVGVGFGRSTFVGPPPRASPSSWGRSRACRCTDLAGRAVRRLSLKIRASIFPLPGFFLRYLVSVKSCPEGDRVQTLRVTVSCNERPLVP